MDLPEASAESRPGARPWTRRSIPGCNLFKIILFKINLLKIILLMINLLKIILLE